jgi:hypothetical protein
MSTSGKAAERPISDETLMRFADGDLPAEEHAFLAARLAAHPEARARLRAYRFTKEKLPQAFAVALDVPSELIDRCLPAAVERRPRWPRLTWRFPGWPVPALAGLSAACAVAASFWLLQGDPRSELAPLLGIPPPSVARALEATAIGDGADLGGGVRLEPVATFASRDRQWCRQFQLSTGNEIRADALACRREGSWRIAVASTARPRPLHAAPGTFSPGGERDDPVSAMRDQIISGDVLTLADEQRLIGAERWERAVTLRP